MSPSRRFGCVPPADRRRDSHSLFFLYLQPLCVALIYTAARLLPGVVEFAAVYTHNSALLAVLDLILLGALIISRILIACKLRVAPDVTVKAELCLVSMILNVDVVELCLNYEVFFH